MKEIIDSISSLLNRNRLPEFYKISRKAIIQNSNLTPTDVYNYLQKAIKDGILSRIIVNGKFGFFPSSVLRDRKRRVRTISSVKQMTHLVVEALQEIAFPGFPPVPLSVLSAHIFSTYTLTLPSEDSFPLYFTQSVTQAEKNNFVQLASNDCVQVTKYRRDSKITEKHVPDIKFPLICDICKELVDPSSNRLLSQCQKCEFIYHSNCLNPPGSLCSCNNCKKIDKGRKRPNDEPIVNKAPKHKTESNILENTLQMTGQLDYVVDEDRELFRQSYSASLCSPSQNSSEAMLIIFGNHVIPAWHTSAYPQEFACLPKLFICDRCLAYMKTAAVLERHESVCGMLHPPGDEIYRRGNISIYEVDGNNDKIYCQNLCLLSRLFLHHKTLYYDVEPFLFYVMTVSSHSSPGLFVGYFSKEKCSAHNYNLSCIMVLPVYQRCGYGYFLIDLSYAISRREGKTGSPEKPLTDHGRFAYQAFWKSAVLGKLASSAKNGYIVSIKVLSDELGMTTHDVAATLHNIGVVVLSGRDFSIELRVDWAVLEKNDKKACELVKRDSFFHEECLFWKPSDGGSSGILEQETEGSKPDCSFQDLSIVKIET